MKKLLEIIQKGEKLRYNGKILNEKCFKEFLQNGLIEKNDNK